MFLKKWQNKKHLQKCIAFIDIVQPKYMWMMYQLHDCDFPLDLYISYISTMIK